MKIIKLNILDKFKILLILLIGLAANLAVAQRMPGLTSSNYNGVYSMMNNPAEVADNTHSFQMNLLMVNYGVSDEFFSSPSLTSPLAPLRLSSRDDQYDPSRSLANLTSDGELMSSSQIIGPSILMQFGETTGIGISTRLRGVVQGSNLPGFLPGFYGDNSLPEDADQSNREDNFSLGAHAFSEVGITYGRSLLDQERHGLKLGFSIKRLVGIHSYQLEAENFDYQISQTGGGENVLDINSMDYRFAYSSAGPQPVSITDAFVGNNEAFGSGWGFDIGLVYELRRNGTDARVLEENEVSDTLNIDDPSHNQYLLKLSASIVDIGNISYSSGLARQFTGQINGSRLSSATIFGNDPIGSMSGLLNLEGNGEEGTQEVGLPTTIHLAADLRLTKSLFINTMYWQTLGNPSFGQIGGRSMISVVPRLELPNVGITAPISLVNQSLQAGVGLKLGPFVLGSDNLLPLLGVSNEPSVGSDIYFAVHLYNMK